MKLPLLHSSRKPAAARLRRTAAAGVIAAITGIATLPASALSLSPRDTYSLPLVGTIRADVVPCTTPSPTNICFRGVYRGVIFGDLVETESLTPPRLAGNGVHSVFDGRQLIRTRRGDLICADTNVVNFGGDGEFITLCNISGGTGDYTGASGYIRLFGTISPTEAKANYDGRLIIRRRPLPQ